VPRTTLSLASSFARARLVGPTSLAHHEGRIARGAIVLQGANLDAARDRTAHLAEVHLWMGMRLTAGPRATELN
jgi:hypothetical protein